MTLNNRYRELMEDIRVTDEMSERILNNINSADINSHKFTGKKPIWYRISAVAACLIAVIGSISMIYSINNVNLDHSSDNTVQQVNGMVEVNSSKELSELLKFNVSELSYIPFKPDKIKYFSCWNEMAQIVYSDENNKITFRQSMGIEDNTGDYTDYSANEIISMGDVEIMLRGNEHDNYRIASWNTGDMSYSVNISTGVSMEEIKKILLGIA